ncbi:FxLD family lanthipeptide [Kitasatospora sp. NPDC059327]|uniref:FxLD family lanthipeptide n=1 Tax=Kitasatospora sp. NPDC059327 TaxID=3346803 RepID=UPI0036CE4AF5
MAPNQLNLPTLQGTDLLDLDVTVTTEDGSDSLADGCGTSDGCGSTCASACTSAV